MVVISLGIIQKDVTVSPLQHTAKNVCRIYQLQNHAHTCSNQHYMILYESYVLKEIYASGVFLIIKQLKMTRSRANDLASSRCRLTMIWKSQSVAWCLNFWWYKPLHYLFYLDLQSFLRNLKKVRPSAPKGGLPSKSCNAKGQVLQALRQP